MTNIQDMVKSFQQEVTGRIGTSLMKPLLATIGNPVDETVFASGTNRAAESEVYIHLLTSEDPTSYTTALRGSFTKKDIFYGRPVLVTINDAGDYVLEKVDANRDAVYSVGIDNLDDQSPVYLKQIMEIGTLHPVEGSLQFRVTSGMFGTDYYSGGDSADFSSGTVQDTTPANITIPTTNGQAKGVLAQLDASTGTLSYKQSSEFSAILSLAQAYKASLLPVADDKKYRLGYLKLVKGITQFTYDHIWEAPELLSKGSSNDISADTLFLNDGSELTIASGAITVTRTRHTVDTEADAASDDLVTVSGLAANEICVITANNTARTVVVKNSGGNISCATGADISLDDNVKAVLLMGNTSGTGVNAYALFGNVSVALPTTNRGIARWAATNSTVIEDSPNTLVYDNGGIDILLAADDFGLYIQQATGQTEDAFILADDNGDPLVSMHPNGGIEMAGVCGLDLPLVTTAQRTALGTSRNGRMVYDTDLHEVYVVKNGTWTAL